MRHNLNKVDGQYSLTSAQRVGGTRQPRAHTVALTDCVCYDSEGNVIRTIGRTAKPRTPSPARKAAVRLAQQERVQARQDRLNLLASISTQAQYD